MTFTNIDSISITLFDYNKLYAINYIASSIYRNYNVLFCNKQYFISFDIYKSRNFRSTYFLLMKCMWHKRYEETRRSCQLRFTLSTPF